jgi:hypothetical protein
MYSEVIFAHVRPTVLLFSKVLNIVVFTCFSLIIFILVTVSFCFSAFRCICLYINAYYMLVSFYYIDFIYFQLSLFLFSVFKYKALEAHHQCK